MFCNQILADFPDIAGAHGDDQVAIAGFGAQLPDDVGEDGDVDSPAAVEPKQLRDFHIELKVAKRE